MSRKPTLTSILVKSNQILKLGVCTTLSIVLNGNTTSAQQTSAGVTGNSGATEGGIKVLAFIEQQMIAVGASISVVFALGVVFAVKFGWMRKDQIKDFIWLILALILIPTIIPAIFTAAG